MLADDIRALAGSDIDRRMADGLTWISEAATRSERFVLGPDAMAAAVQAVALRPSSILAALPLCRPPFREAWLEWDGVIPGNPERDDTPSRIGFYVACVGDDHRQFRATMAWKPSRRQWARGGRGEPIPMIALSSILCDFSGAADPMALYDGPLPRTALRRQLDPKRHGFERGPRSESAAYRDLLACVAVTPNALGMRLLKIGNLTVRDLFSQEGNPYADGDAASLLAALCLINCSTGVTVEAAAVAEKLQKARAKLGKAALLDHSTVRMALSRRDRGGASATPSALRQHLVRGHFKLRRGGLHWWRPFLRGDARQGTVKHDHYVI